MQEDRQVKLNIDKTIVEQLGVGAITEIVSGLSGEIEKELKTNGRAQVLLTVE